MIKRIWLFVLSFTVILLTEAGFADVIEPNMHYVNRCVKLQNVTIDGYRLIVENDTVTSRDLYVPQANECLKWHYKFGESRQYLVDGSVNLDELTKENIQNRAIQIWNLNVNWHYVDDSNPLTNENFTYKIVKKWNDYILEESVGEDVKSFQDEIDYSLEIVESEQWIELVNNNRLVKFLIAWILTIIIETIILFVIAKLFRKEEQISNWRLIFAWIFASTITLPLLRFVLPLFINDGVEYMVIWESLVTLIEIFILKYRLKISRWKAISVSVVCNLCSFLIWLLLF